MPAPPFLRHFLCPELSWSEESKAILPASTDGLRILGLVDELIPVVPTVGIHSLVALALRGPHRILPIPREQRGEFAEAVEGGIWRVRQFQIQDIGIRAVVAHRDVKGGACNLSFVRVGREPVKDRVRSTERLPSRVRKSRREISPAESFPQFWEDVGRHAGEYFDQPFL